jgi:molybdopterin synthase catalytic subunit
MRVRIVATALDPWAEIAAYQAGFDAKGAFGATAVFVGTMRDFNAGRAVAAMTLEHYPGMTERHLERVQQDAAARWALIDALVVHRVGEMAPGDPIVVVAVWSAHRADALAAAGYIIDELKARAPFWKREQTPQGARWVSGSGPETGNQGG